MATSTTYAPSGITTGLAVEVDNVIQNIAPYDTTFLSNIGKQKVKTKYFEWLEDTLATASNNAVTEGNDAVLTTITAQSRYGNYTQISAKWFAISDTLEMHDKYGRKSEIAYQTGLKLKELAKDMEYALINNAAATSDDPRSTKGLKGWISTCINFTTGTASTTLTETYFNDELQRAWERGGNPDMIICPAKAKRTISTFDGQSRLTVNTDASAQKVINSVDFYESDFGVVKVYLNRNIATDDDTYYESIFFLEKSKWALGVLKPVTTEKLAKTGLSQKIQISTEYGLVSKAETASGWVKNAYNG